MKQGPYSPGNKKDKIGYETQRKKTLIPPYKNKDYAISIQIKIPYNSSSIPNVTNKQQACAQEAKILISTEKTSTSRYQDILESSMTM